VSSIHYWITERPLICRRKNGILQFDLQADNFVARTLLGKPIGDRSLSLRAIYEWFKVLARSSSLSSRCTCNMKEHGNMIAMLRLYAAPDLET
jgi:hypothetical protein